jgi:formylglycine-generating enzyme required for sulfatase activity
MGMGLPGRIDDRVSLRRGRCRLLGFCQPRRPPAAEFAACTARENYTKAEPITNPSRYDDWIPRDDRFDDGGFVTTETGRYQANAWGLHDMIGNAWEWTGDSTARGDRIARGGSWYDRPEKATIGERVSFRPYQRVFNVGFRIVFEESPNTAAK